MSPIRCLTCGLEFAPFGGAERAVANFNAHRCARQTATLNHPSNPTWRPGGAA